jgi:hypothetical protein
VSRRTEPNVRDPHGPLFRHGQQSSGDPAHARREGASLAAEPFPQRRSHPDRWEGFEDRTRRGDARALGEVGGPWEPAQQRTRSEQASSAAWRVGSDRAFNFASLLPPRRRPQSSLVCGRSCGRHSSSSANAHPTTCTSGGRAAPEPLAHRNVGAWHAKRRRLSPAVPCAHVVERAGAKCSRPSREGRRFPARGGFGGRSEGRKGLIAGLGKHLRYNVAEVTALPPPLKCAGMRCQFDTFFGLRKY